MNSAACDDPSVAGHRAAAGPRAIGRLAYDRMFLPHFIVIAVVVATTVACSISGRRDGVAARHDLQTYGWIQFAVIDRSIPPDPFIEEELQPPACEIEVRLDGQAVHSEMLRPAGSSPPYSLESEFRIRAPAGEHIATIYYSSCRVYRRQLDSLELEVRVDVYPGHVTRMKFDGSSVSAFPPEAAPDSSERSR